MAKCIHLWETAAKLGQDESRHNLLLFCFSQLLQILESLRPAGVQLTSPWDYKYRMFEIPMAPKTEISGFRIQE